jgi:hypothetical protein
VPQFGQVQSAGDTKLDESEKHFAIAYRREANIGSGAVRGQKVKLSGDGVFQAYQLATETYNRSVVQSRYSEDAQGFFPSCSAAA